MASAPPSSRGFARMARDSVLFATGSVVGKVVGLALLPVLTRLLTPVEYGQVDVLTTLQSALAAVLLLGFDLAATRLYADLHVADRRRMFSTWLCGVTAVGVAVTAGLWVFGSEISNALFSTSDLRAAVLLAGVAALANAVQLISLTALRNDNRPGVFAAVSSLTLVSYGLAVAVIVPRRPTVTAVLVAVAVSMLLGAAGGLSASARLMKGRLSAELGRRLALLGLPLVPAVLAQWVSEFANRAILLSQSGPQEVAYFSVATRFSSIALLVVLGFQLAWQPAAFSLGEGRAALQQVATDGRRIMAGVAGSVVAVALSSPELVVLAGGRQYSPALPAVGLSLVFALGYAAYHTATLPSAISRRMRDLGLAAVLAAAIGITLNLWLSGMWGATGTAAAIAVGQVGAAAVGFLLARARAPVPYPWGRILVISGAAGFVACAATFPDGGASVAWRVVLALGFLAVAGLEGSLGEAAGIARRRVASRAAKRS